MHLFCRSQIDFPLLKPTDGSADCFVFHDLSAVWDQGTDFPGSEAQDVTHRCYNPLFSLPGKLESNIKTVAQKTPQNWGKLHVVVLKRHLAAGEKSKQTLH